MKGIYRKSALCTILFNEARNVLIKHRISWMVRDHNSKICINLHYEYLTFFFLSSQTIKIFQLNNFRSVIGYYKSALDVNSRDYICMKKISGKVRVEVQQCGFRSVIKNKPHRAGVSPYCLHLQVSLIASSEINTQLLLLI